MVRLFNQNISLKKKTTKKTNNHTTDNRILARDLPHVDKLRETLFSIGTPIFHHQLEQLPENRDQGPSNRINSNRIPTN